MSLKDVRGQESAINFLKSSIACGRVGSAYLFQGLSGTGKMLTALNFAKALNCASSRNEEEKEQFGIFGEMPPEEKNTGGAFIEINDACDKCDSCKRIEQGIHSDVIVVRPTKKPERDIESIRFYENEKSRKGSREIKIKQIRLLEGALSLAAYEARYKVAILDEAHLMNTPAANAFLKTLEEPPPGTVIILVSASTERLPDTVRSRCLALNFKPLSEEEMEGILTAEYPQPERRQTLIKLSMGRPGLALSGELFEKRKDFLKSLSEMAGGSSTAPWLDKEDIGDFIDMCGLLLRDMLIYKLTGDPGLLINADISKSINSLGKGAPEDVIIDCYGKIAALKANLVYNPNKSILWNYMGALLGTLKIRKEAFANA